MRRVLRGHDKPYAILESFGGQPSGDFWVAETYLLEHLAKVAQGLREGAPAFDFYCTEFWHDAAGDLTTFLPKGFPNGYGRVRDEILKLGMRPGLWIDSGGLPQWTIGDNPAVRGCFTKGDGKGEICRASEPINTMYKKAFIHHVRENKVGLLKFDNMGPGCQPPCCDNPAHAHLPGPLYSVEAIHNAIIDFFRELDTACPDVFIMLYWGYRVRGGFEYGDTYFENGHQIEAASPAEFPAPYARDSVTQRLDQAQSLIARHALAGQGFAGGLAFRLAVEQLHRKGSLAGRAHHGHLPRQPAGSGLDGHGLADAGRAQAVGRFRRAAQSPAGLLREFPLHSGRSLEARALRILMRQRQRAFLAIHNACLEDRS